MKSKLQLLLIIFTIALASSCDEDPTGPSNSNLPFFSINEGNVWYYDYIIIENGKDSVNRKYKEYISEPSVIEGKSCFKYNIIEEGENQNRVYYNYVKTEEDGYYIFFDYIYLNDRHYIDKLKNIWVKYIDFKQNNWTQIDLRIDTLYENNERQRSYLNISGSTVKSEVIEYKGRTHQTFKTLFKITVEDTLTVDEEIISINSEVSGFEITSINGIGIYKRRFLFNDVISDSYRILTNHK